MVKIQIETTMEIVGNRKIPDLVEMFEYLKISFKYVEKNVT